MPDHATRASQDYLKAIHDAGGADERVATRAITARLGVQAPSVTNMLRRLADAGWIEYEPHRGARLTAKGLAEARRVVRRHQLVECFLVTALGYDLAEVHPDAEVLEHAISPRLERALAEYLGEPVEGPFGHPIPAPDGSVVRRRLRPVGEFAAGQCMVVREVEDGDANRLRRWRELGLVPGARVRVVGCDPLDGVLDLQIGGERVRLEPRAVVGVRCEAVPDGHPGRRDSA
ncbi:MAG: metal-dependent transcriptional regulator [Gemmataceae bacterium]|nr:metal-dependent transcriptional regulator [Gemmataceae bacterium]